MNEYLEKLHDSKFDGIQGMLNSHESVQNIPTVCDNHGILWFSITQEEKDLLKEYLHLVDSVPEDVWRQWDDDVLIDISARGNFANRIILNSKVR